MEGNRDIFNASIAYREGDPLPGTWGDPDDLKINRINDLRYLILNHTNFNSTQKADWNQQWDDEIDWTNNNPGHFTNEKITSLFGEKDYYYMNGTLKEDGGLPSDAPAIPDPTVTIFDGPPMFLPSNWNWSHQLDFVEDLVNWGIPQIPEEMNATDDIADFDDVTDIIGVSNLFADTRAIGIYFSLADVDWDKISDIVDDIITLSNDTEDGDGPSGMLEMADLELVGIERFKGGFGISLEYDEDFALLAASVYMAGGATLNTSLIDFNSTMFANGSWTVENQNIIDTLDITSEDFGIALNMSICREGYVPPSLQQILDGDLGDNRDQTDPDFGGLFANIPSYPIAVISVFGLITIASIIRKRR